MLKPQKSPLWILKTEKSKNEEVRNFPVLDKGDYKTAWLFAYQCPFGRQRCALATWGRSTPFPHAYRENQPIFKIRGFPATHVGFGVDGPYKTAEHLQNTPRTPPVRLRLAAAGSQFALYMTETLLRHQIGTQLNTYDRYMIGI